MAGKSKAAERAAKGMAKLQSIMNEMADDEVAEVALRMRAKLKRIKAGRE